MTTSDAPKYTKKDFQTDQEVRWCPGCGDYAILATVQSTFAKLGIPKERFVLVSGIGCSSRFPYYMETYGFHTLHGRAPGVATGIKLANPELSVWVVTGDGDALAIGTNHLLHALRRNVGIKILMFNNRIYGLTKGQASPTSEPGKKTPSTPLGTVDAPFNPLALALGAGASFVARSVDRFGPHLSSVLERAAAHEGSAFVEIFQNCNIFNDGAFGDVTGKSERHDNVLYLEEGAPMLFGRERPRALVRDGRGGFLVADAAEGAPENVAIHEEAAAGPVDAFALSQLEPPAFPVPIGVLRAERRPTLEEGQQALDELAAKGRRPPLGDLLRGPNTWEVR